MIFDVFIRGIKFPKQNKNKIKPLKKIIFSKNLNIRN